MRGEGAYEGLTALMGIRLTEDPCGMGIRGVVFDGEMPPFPELPPAE